MPDISTVERKIMENQKKPPFVPLEMKGRMTKNTYKKQGSSEPDWKGTFMYEGQIITFGAWENDAGFGPYYNIKLKAPTKSGPRHKSFCARSKNWKGERGKAARKRWGCR